MSRLNKINAGQLILGDILLFFMIALLALLSLAFFKLFSFFYTPGFIFQLVFLFFALYFSLCFMALAIPKVQPGHYELSDPKVRLWFIGFVFGRIWHFPVFMYPIFNSLLLRTLFLRCLGCRAPLNSAISSDLSIYDPHLVEIGQNVVIGMKSTIVPHYIVHGKLYLGKVSIGEGSLVGAGASIIAGSTIGKNVKINGGCTLLPDSQLPDGVNLKSFGVISKSDQFSENQNIEAYYQSKI
jgi:hypothetical protein